MLERHTKRRRSPQSKRRSTRTGQPARLLALFAGIAAFITLIALGVLYINYSTNPVVIPTVAMLPSDTPTLIRITRAAPTEIPSATPTVTLTPTTTITPTPTETLPPVITATTAPTSTEQARAMPTQMPVPTDILAEGTEEAIPTATQPNPCISLVGDSVTHGGVTYEIPATGYIVGLTNPLSLYLEQALREHGITDIQVYDRGASNTGISSTNHPSYFKTAAYHALRSDHCKYTMIMPWLNDISPGLPAEEAAPKHVHALVGLMQQLAADNPAGKIVVLDYFHGNVAPFAAQTWASGFTPEDVDIYNHEIGLSCNMGTLGAMSQVSCVNIDDAFEGMGTSYVIEWISHQDLSAQLIAPLHPVQQAWLDNYYAVNPGGLLQGDGVHLSIEGKKRLAAFLITMM